jgi:hypothetical protein
MKKIYTLLLLFTITLFYSIPTQAYTLNDLDVPISRLNNLTLREVFIDNNIILNSEFNNGTANWTIIGATGSVVNGIYTFTAFEFIGRIQSTPPISILNNVYYHASRVRVSTTGVFSVLLNGNASIQHPGNNVFMTLTARETALVGNDSFSILDTKSTGSTFTPIEVDYFRAYNLTALGLTSLSKLELDFFYNEFEKISAFIEGYNDGYDEGFDDGVASETSYAVGYALGLSEGEDMETGSSLLILIVAAIGFIMMIFGFATKRRIFNLLSVGAFIVLGGLLAEFVGFIIITVGLVFVNVYYTFFGDI